LGQFCVEWYVVLIFLAYNSCTALELQLQPSYNFLQQDAHLREPELRLRVPEEARVWLQDMAIYIDEAEGEADANTDPSDIASHVLA
jgi:hypothetical protein